MMRKCGSLLLFAATLYVTPQADASRADLTARQDQLAESLKRVSPAVVAVTDGIGFGTGVIVTGDGVVLTASHVIESHHHPRRSHNRPLRVIFPDGETAKCKLLGRNRYCDAAVLKITDEPQEDEFPHAPMGRSSSVKRGDWCFALGHPGGRREDRPAVMRFGRVLSVSDQTVVSDNAIVLGDSGGPLFDLQGQVIGIHSMITRVIVENRHVAIDVWHRDWKRLLNGDAWGKLRVSDDELAASRFVGVGLKWKDYQATVKRVVVDSPAARAGFREGDELIKVEGRTFADRLGLSSLLARLSDNQTFDVIVRRNGREKKLNVVTGKRPDFDDDSLEPTPEEEEFAREFQKQIGFERNVGNNEKRTASAMRDYAGITRRTRGNIVQFRANKRPIAYGIVMSADGDVLTKASELTRANNVTCILPDGSSCDFQHVAKDIRWDLALVKLDVKGLRPIKWAESRPETGRLLVTPNLTGGPLLPGIVSIPPLELPTSSQGFLGVRLAPYSGDGARVGSLLAGGAARRDGVRAGDVILSIDGERIRGMNDTIRRIKNFEPNRQITLRVLRGNKIRRIEVTLTPRFVSDRQDALLSHYTDADSAGKFASIHNSGFPEVIQHDTDLFPHQCGGPVLDINGNAVGMNIARAARIISYAIPADAVQRVYQSLRADGLASR